MFCKPGFPGFRRDGNVSKPVFCRHFRAIQPFIPLHDCFAGPGRGSDQTKLSFRCSMSLPTAGSCPLTNAHEMPSNRSALAPQSPSCCRSRLAFSRAAASLSAVSSTSRRPAMKACHFEPMRLVVISESMPTSLHGRSVRWQGRPALSVASWTRNVNRVHQT